MWAFTGTQEQPSLFGGLVVLVTNEVRQFFLVVEVSLLWFGCTPGEWAGVVLWGHLSPGLLGSAELVPQFCSQSRNNVT